jgi:nucleoside-diphosphate-sugar epimerase
VRDKQAVGTAVLDDVDCVFHLATRIDVLGAVEDPGLDAQVSVGGTVTVLNACVEAHVRRFIVSSTGGALWGIPSALPATDESAIQPCASNLDRGRGDDLAQDLMDRGLIACTATDAHDAGLRVPRSICNGWGMSMLKEGE